MIRRKVKAEHKCGLDAALEVVGGRWKVLILWHLTAEPKRFGELKRLLPDISEKMLIQQLRALEADEVVRRTAYPEIPPRVEYALTKFGVSLKEALSPLCQWGSKHMERIEKRREAEEAEAPRDLSTRRK